MRVTWRFQYRLWSKELETFLAGILHVGKKFHNLMIRFSSVQASGIVTEFPADQLPWSTFLPALLEVGWIVVPHAQTMHSLQGISSPRPCLLLHEGPPVFDDIHATSNCSRHIFTRTRTRTRRIHTHAHLTSSALGRSIWRCLNARCFMTFLRSCAVQGLCDQDKPNYEEGLLLPPYHPR